MKISELEKRFRYFHWNRINWFRKPKLQTALLNNEGIDLISILYSHTPLPINPIHNHWFIKVSIQLIENAFQQSQVIICNLLTDIRVICFYIISTSWNYRWLLNSTYYQYCSTSLKIPADFHHVHSICEFAKLQCLVKVKVRIIIIESVQTLYNVICAVYG